MCGLAGVLTTRANLELGPLLPALGSALLHRGPDDQGTAEVLLPDGLRLGLAATRLAILDLSPAGHQPMTDRASGSWIVYNGEIYNHQDIRKQLDGCEFAGNSDTETLLKSWVHLGPSVLNSLRGMFAFALYDARRSQFWLVRDRLGVKPLYAFPAGSDTWLFASEIRTLLATDLVPRRLHAVAIDAYLAFGAVPAPWTLVKGVISLQAGEAWRFDLPRAGGALTPHRVRYWRPPFVAPAGVGPNHAEAVAQIRPVLDDAVSLRMRSDVPIGVFLSGGIDSSSVVASLCNRGHKLRTFSVVFGEKAYDESRYSRAVAQWFRTNHAELTLQPSKVLDELTEALACYDQPSIDGINTYFLAQLTRQAGVKVALSGLGGDELFAGYPNFRYLDWLDRRWPRALAWLYHQLLQRIAPREMRTQKLAALLANHASKLESHAACRQIMLPSRRGEVLNAFGHGNSLPLPAAVVGDLEEALGGLDPVNAYSLLELSLYLGNMLLRDTDQMSMAHALEVRVPLLDHVLVETVARIPGRLKLAAGKQGRVKSLLVDSVPADLPPFLHRRAKMGFVFPWESWLRRELKGRVSEVLTNPTALARVGLSCAAVGSLWDDFLAKRPGVRHTDVLCLFHLISWTERHHIHLDLSEGDANRPCSVLAPPSDQD